MLKRASLALSHYPDACFRVCSCSTSLRMYPVVKNRGDLNVVQKSNQDYRRTPKKLQSVLNWQKGVFSILVTLVQIKFYLQKCRFQVLAIPLATDPISRCEVHSWRIWRSG
uniref:GG13752 n=1 Tax=Drosophila erecta TaxID=7220 RepID=B3P2R8_DROER